MMETISMMAMTGIWCAAAVLCYRQGLADGGCLARKGQLDRRERQPGPEPGHFRRLLDRIDRYDGRTRQEGGN